MKVKTSELSGVQLDVAVAIAIGGHITRAQDAQVYLNGMHQLCGEENKRHSRYVFSPSTNWSQCGNLIEAEGIEFKWVSDATLEAHSYLHDPHYGYGLTHQEAACRLIVASKLGDEVDIPDELMNE